MALLSVAGLYIAGIIGAGFASGQELVFFFVNYGWGGIVGALVALAILTLGSAAVLEYCHRRQVDSYDRLWAALGRNQAIFFDALYTGFLLIGVSVMLAGAAALSATASLALRAGTALFVYLALCQGVLGVLRLGTGLAPMIITWLVALSAHRLRNYPPALCGAGSWRGVEAGVLYASYNLSFSLAVFTSMHHIVPKRWERLCLALLGNGILAIVMFVIIFSLSSLPAPELNSPIPLLRLAAAWGPAPARAYGLVLWLSMYTTALANSLALVKRITITTGKTWPLAAALVLAAAFCLSYFGFTNLIRVAYPVMGLAALYLLAQIIKLSF